MKSTGKNPYILLDRVSRNVLGESETLEEAVTVLLRFVKADPSAADQLELWHEERKRPPVDPEKLRRVTGRRVRAG